MGGISLPFEPLDLVAEAQRAWLGVDVSPDGPDIHVVAYAVDGRPAPRSVDGPRLSREAASRREPAPPVTGYDDYEDDSGETPEGAHWADRMLSVARRVGTGAVRRLGVARRWVQEKIRHSDRPHER